MAQEEYMKQFGTLLNSLTPKHLDVLVTFRDNLVVGIEMFKNSQMETKFFEIELELVNRKLVELDSLE